MGSNRVFFPQAALDGWIAEDRVELTRSELVIKAEGRRYTLTEAVRVLGEVTSGEDVYGVVGKVRERGALEAAGAELFESSMVWGEYAFEVVPGWLGLPVGSFDAHITGRVRREALAPESSNDEDLLANFLMKNLE
ncbi:MAG: hypothetical protein KIT72_02130 [Polyangiaceae bacterium]|nr:hypothetical protein [Polyangiaceae bacterium]MCW5789195.1 hypothetical protein [Polyangiaceae bacterium]